MLSEKVLIKLQAVLGDKYQRSLGNAFSRKFTNPDNNDINFQAFESLENITPAVFTMQPANYNVAPFMSYNTNWELQFWCAIDNLKIDKNGTPLEVPAGNIFTDLETLRTTLAGKITVETGLYARMTFSEPVIGTAMDKTGQYKRVVISVRGLINLTDKGKFASDTIIKLGVAPSGGGSDVFFEMKGITQRLFNFTADGISTHEQGQTMADIDGEALTNGVSFSYDDWDDSTNLAMALLRDIAKGKIITDSAFTIPVQIYDGATLVASYDALLEVNIIAPQGESGLERVDVTLQRAGV